MRERHPVFDRDIPTESAIWRYFDLPKFLSFLQRRALYFSRANLLGDPLEGSFPRTREAERQRLLANPPTGFTREELERVFQHNLNIYKRMPSQAFINCWHLGNHESMAMWQEYGGGSYGIAVRSTFGELDELLPPAFPGVLMGEIHIGRVHYCDYASDSIKLREEMNVYAPFVSKSMPYRHENELQAVFVDLTLGQNQSPPAGHFVPVDIKRLVGAITISPLAPTWFPGVVREVCRSHELDVEVEQSSVFTEPIY
jgi:hypothetical protein